MRRALLILPLALGLLAAGCGSRRTIQKATTKLLAGRAKAGTACGTAVAEMVE